MIKKNLLTVLVAVLASSAAFAQKPDEKPLTESDLLKQIETLNPKGMATPAPSVVKGAPSLLTSPLFNDQSTLGDAPKPPSEKTGQTGEKKSKGPTEITALEAVFDQRANLAVFVGSVVVKDPEFNVVCDKLTAHLKHDDKSAPDANSPAVKATPKPATPNQEGGTAVKKKQGGLESAVAITTSERRVIITQDKVEADGSITHGIGIANQADYNAITGNIVLTGMPDVTQGVNRCIATDPSTVMTLNRDGHMTAKGPHKTIITDSSDSRSAK